MAYGTSGMSIFGYLWMRTWWRWIRLPVSGLLMRRRRAESERERLAVYAAAKARAALRPRGDFAEIDALIAQRSAARARKDFAEADRIRSLLAERRIILEDRGAETEWRSANA